VLLAPKYEAWTRVLRDRWTAAMGADAERVVLLPSMPRGDFLSLLALGDVMLDPFPYGGGNTTLEALAMGLPVVTWPTEHVRGRLSYAFLRRAGLETGLASSAESYVETALRLAHDLELRARTRAEIAERCSVLFDDFGPIEEVAAVLLRECA
jgi:predicted O-linked N-acetylglucosamine transferase (SPINDLY family)